MHRWQGDYGDLMRFRLGHRSFYQLSHPELAEKLLIEQVADFDKMGQSRQNTGFSLVFGQGLVTSYGELWRRQRRLIQPVFHRSKVAEFGGRMVECGEQMLKRWETLPTETGIHIGQEMMQLTLEIICQTMFNRSVLGQSLAISQALDVVLRYATETLRNPLLPPLFLPTPGNRRFRQALAVLDGVIAQIIQERRQQNSPQADFLTLLLEARDEETGAAMSDQQVRDEVLTVFVAGHETTATALTWVFGLLAQNPEARTKLEQELDAVLQGKPPTVSDLPQLPYTRAVFDEALRLYPPAPGILRSTNKAVKLWGYTLPKNAILFANFYNIQRHTDFWPSPDQFRPERFLAHSPKPAHRLAYLPFSAGPRVCAGSHFALTEGPLLLALIAQRFQLDFAQGQSLQAELHATLKPKADLTMTLRQRN